MVMIDDDGNDDNDVVVSNKQSHQWNDMNTGLVVVLPSGDMIQTGKAFFCIILIYIVIFVF
jgi:hypothetical protein